jgi:hypothetical protein
MTPHLIAEALNPETLRQYGLPTGSLDADQCAAIRQAAAGFKPNRIGSVVNALAKLTVSSPAQAGALAAAVTELAGLRQFNYDASGLIAGASSPAELLSQAAAKQASFTGKSQAKAGDEFSVNDTPPEWTDGRYRVYAAATEGDCIRYGQNERYGFCISRRQNNYYHDYRAKNNAAYYFVYDTQLTPFDKKHITVISAHQDGTFGFTYANNSEDYDTRSLKGSLDKYLATKPGLEAARALFVPRPLSPMEATDVAAARQVAAAEGEGFAELSPAQQMTYVRLGKLLSDPGYAAAPPALRELYIARAHMLTDAQAAASTEGERRRAAQLFWRHNVIDKDHPAAWLTDYPQTDAQADKARSGKASSWPPAPSAVADWFGPAKPAPTPLEESVDPRQFGLLRAGSYGQRLAVVLGQRPSRELPLSELRWDSNDQDHGPVNFVRLNEAYVALTGGAGIEAAYQAGEFSVAARFITADDRHYAAGRDTLLEHARRVHAADFGFYATRLVEGANEPLPEAVLLAADGTEQQKYLKRLLAEGYHLSAQTQAALPQHVQRRYWELLQS